MKVETTRIPKKYEDAIGHWVKHNFQDLPLLDKYWDKYFPADDAFCLCAKLDLSTSQTQEVGDHKGDPKAEDPSQLTEEAAKHLLAIIARRPRPSSARSSSIRSRSSARRPTRTSSGCCASWPRSCGTATRCSTC
jgi:hypothetical protein